MQIVSGLSKLIYKLYHLLIYGSWYVYNGFLLCYIYLIHIFQEVSILSLIVLYYLFFFLEFISTISFSIFTKQTQKIPSKLNLLFSIVYLTSWICRDSLNFKQLLVYITTSLIFSI